VSELEEELKNLEALSKEREDLQRESERITQTLTTVRRAEEGLRRYIEYLSEKQGPGALQRSGGVSQAASIEGLKLSLAGACKGMSRPDAAEFILKKAGRPLHLKELCELLPVAGVKSKSKNHKTVVYLALHKYEPQRFRKVAPSTWTLAEPKEGE